MIPKDTIHFGKYSPSINAMMCISGIISFQTKIVSSISFPWNWKGTSLRNSINCGITFPKSWLLILISLKFHESVNGLISVKTKCFVNTETQRFWAQTSYGKILQGCPRKLTSNVMPFIGHRAAYPRKLNTNYRYWPQPYVSLRQTGAKNHDM